MAAGLLSRKLNAFDYVAFVGLTVKISEVFFVFCKALAHTTLQTLWQQDARSRLVELLSLRITLRAALSVSLESKATNIRLRRQAPNVIHSKALFAA